MNESKQPMPQELRLTEGGWYLTKLRKLLVEYFNLGELQTLCFDLDVDYDSLPGEGKASKARELVAYLGRRGIISKLVRIGKQQRPDIPWEDRLPEYHPVPFRDQDVVKNIILSAQAPYHLLDAPAGYGKTELLLEIGQILQGQGWVCTYVSADEYPRLPDLARALFKELDLGEPPNGSDAERLGLELAGALRRKRLEDIQKAGLIFLIDFGKMPSPLLITQLLEDFVPSVQRSLRDLKFFKNKHNRFRIVLAGRYLAARGLLPKPFPLSIIQLLPFSYKILLDTAIDYLADSADEVIPQISAHIMHMTGGHPGCMASLLEMYKESGYPVDDFLNSRKDEIQEIIEYEVEWVHQSIPAKLRDVMDVLGMFRYLNSDTLSCVIREGCVPGYSDAYTLADDLTTSYLMGRKGRLLRNDSTHRLLALRLRQQKEPCIRAQRICAEYLGTVTAFRPELWVIEYLYQYLQQFTPVSHDPKERAKLRETFLGQKVPSILHRFVDAPKGEDVRWQQRELEQALDEDEEFRFTVNYFLRQDQYNDEPYQDFRHRVDQFFAQGIGGDNA
jgi:hypothetical protein